MVSEELKGPFELHLDVSLFALELEQRRGDGGGVLFFPQKKT